MSYLFKYNCLKFSIVSFLLLFFQAASAQATFTALESILNEKQKVLGADVVVQVASKDTVVYQKSPKLFNGRTQAPVGHSSQWLTAALILQLADEGKLSLDDKVSQYLPVFEKYGKNYITIRHCLTHFTGIQAEPVSKALKMFEKKKFQTLEEEVAAIAAKEIQTNPGTEFRYSTFGPAIAARVAEVVSKKKFDLLIQQKLFRPLGMRQTTFSTLDASAPDAAAGARSTANDLTTFLRMLLHGGTYRGVQVLSANAINEFKKVGASAASIKNAPEAVKSFDYTMGAWAPEQKSGMATVLAGPSLGGTLPLVDFCRGYAFVLVVKEVTDDPKANVYPGIKQVLDAAFPNKCQ